MNYQDQVRNRYFEWLYNYACKGRINEHISFRKLFANLHDTQFDFYIRNDVNRAMDGVNLRYRFATVVRDDEAFDILSDYPCSVLEMMLALAIRTEEQIMDDPQYGDRTQQWFWGMLSNIGISSISDDVYDEQYVNERIYRLLERRYEPNGKGGLFYIRDCDTDLRDVEIWTQLCWYLNTIS